MANYDCFVFAGHGDGDSGAVGNGYKEHEQALILTNKVAKLLTDSGLKVQTGYNNYNKKLTSGNTYKYKFGYSIHLNAATAAANGCEVYVPCGEKYLNVESNILDELAKLGFTNRGIKSRDYNTGNYINRTNGKAVSGTDYYKEIRDAWNNKVSLSLLEVCFISNANDMKLFTSKIDDIAYIIAKEIGKACGVTVTKPVATPATTSNVTYRVVCGSFKDKAAATARMNEIKSKTGYDCFLLAHTV